MQNNKITLKIYGETHNDPNHMQRKLEHEKLAKENKIILMQEGLKLDFEKQKNIYGVEDAIVYDYGITLRTHTNVQANIQEFIRVSDLKNGEPQIFSYVKHLDNCIQKGFQNYAIPRQFITEIVVDYLRNFFFLAFGSHSLRDLTCKLLEKHNLLQEVGNFSKKYDKGFEKGNIDINDFDLDFFKTFFLNKNRWNNFLKNILLPEVLAVITKNYSSKYSLNVDNLSVEKLNAFFDNPFSEEGKCHADEILINLRNNIIYNSFIKIMEENKSNQIEEFVFIVGDDHIEGIKNLFLMKQNKFDDYDLEIIYEPIKKVIEEQVINVEERIEQKSPTKTAPNSSLYKSGHDEPLDEIKVSSVNSNILTSFKEFNN